MINLSYYSFFAMFIKINVKDKWIIIKGILKKKIKKKLSSSASYMGKCTHDIPQLKINIVLPNLFAAASCVISNNCLPYFSKLAFVTPTIFNISSSVSGKD